MTVEPSIFLGFFFFPHSLVFLVSDCIELFKQALKILNSLAMVICARMFKPFLRSVGPDFLQILYHRCPCFVLFHDFNCPKKRKHRGYTVSLN